MQKKRWTKSQTEAADYLINEMRASTASLKKGVMKLQKGVARSEEKLSDLERVRVEKGHPAVKPGSVKALGKSKK